MTSKAKRLSQSSGEEFLRRAFALQQEVLLTQLKLAAESITHDGKFGDVTERHFIAILRRYLPFRYQIDSAIVIDNYGKTSEQIDVVIYDRHFTPTLLDQEGHRYVPAEAVHAVFELKPTINKQYLRYAAAKAASVRALERTSIGFNSANGWNPPKKLFPIISGIIAPRAEWRTGLRAPAFKKTFDALKGRHQLDCVLALEAGTYDRFGPKGGRHHGGAANCLVSFLFRLLSELQSQASVPAVAWDAYARNFKH
ncbi:MAG: hypothetical protein KDK74_08105 [Cephaloticoccus sp.]|nr:hypothetical protein [Cephaloticoccus sp.]